MSSIGFNDIDILLKSSGFDITHSILAIIFIAGIYIASQLFPLIKIIIEIKKSLGSNKLDWYNKLLENENLPKATQQQLESERDALLNSILTGVKARKHHDLIIKILNDNKHLSSNYFAKVAQYFENQDGYIFVKTGIGYWFEYVMYMTVICLFLIFSLMSAIGLLMLNINADYKHALALAISYVTFLFIAVSFRALLITRKEVNEANELLMKAQRKDEEIELKI